jgi:molybdopterin-synthase adenylyltransferase
MSTGARHRRLARTRELGPAAPERLASSSALVVGCGALGSAAASFLVRAGVGRVRVVDRDVVEEGNLGDQCLYTEEDAAARVPKAEAAAAALRRFDGEVEVEALVADFSPENARRLLEDVDVALDGVDNLEAKYLLNDAAVASGTPWVYGGCAGTTGSVLAVVPGRTSCLRCIWPEPPTATRVDGCESMGILEGTAATVAALQVAEAMKILLGHDERDLVGLTRIDVWSGRSRRVPVPAYRPERCPACGEGRFPALASPGLARADVLCGRDTVLIREPSHFDLESLRRRLGERLAVAGSEYLRFEEDGCTFVVFPSGRALVHGTDDPREARALYGRYVAP